MSIFTKSLLLLGMPAMALQANAGTVPDNYRGTDLTKFVYKAHNSRDAFGSPRLEQVRDLDARMMLRTGALNSAEPAPGFEPLSSMTATSTFGELDFPGGETWFYTMDGEYNYIKHNEYWTEKILKGYTIRIYDSKRELVGTIVDDFPYLDDEPRAPYCDVTPIVTKNFFNDDDSYEIMVGAAVNSNVPGVVRYRTYIYQINPESEERVTDYTSVLNGMISDVCDATLPGAEENVYMTFAREYVNADESFDELYEKWTAGEDVDWWNDWFMKQFMQLEVFGKADSNGELQLILDHTMPIQSLPGDQESTPALISMARDGNAYFVLSQYGEPFYNDHGMDYEVDLTMRDPNSLVIDIYKITGLESEKTQTTVIPVTKAANPDVVASYYSVGDFRWREDIRWREDGKADFFITVYNYITSSDESSPHSYYAYSAEGELQATLCEDALGTSPMSDIAGFEPQQMFVTFQNNTLLYSFVDLVSFKQKLTLDYMLKIGDSDPDPMTTNLDRTAYGEGYAYVSEMRYPLEEDADAYMRFAWIQDDGSFIRFDEVNLGTNILYAQSYLTSRVLQPGFYISGENPAYMILMKRGQSDGTNHEELLIGEPCSDAYPEGHDLLVLGPCDKGALSSIYPVSNADGNSLVVTYVAGGSITIDTYALPLDKDPSSVGSIAADSASPVFIYDGSAVRVTEGAPVRVIDLQGRTVASGNGSVSVVGLTPGVYVVESEGATKKLFVK